MRVDRRYSPLGNPYVVRREEEREAACDAYEELLLGPVVAAGDPERVREIGAMSGFFGETKRWDGDAARKELGRLAGIAASQPLRLDCHCNPRRCHAYTVATIAAGKWKIVSVQSENVSSSCVPPP